MDPQHVKTVTIVMSCLLACMLAVMIVAMWRRAQHEKAARRVRDRLAQEEDPEGWARQQARQAREAALIAAELAAMRRATWYGRLLARARREHASCP
jgi:choline-glycine betaine transporter